MDELSMWQARIGQRPVPPALQAELEAAMATTSEARVARHLRRLRALWEMLYPDESLTTPA
jgi:hypothetical protein